MEAKPCFSTQSEERLRERTERPVGGGGGDGAISKDSKGQVFFTHSCNFNPGYDADSLGRVTILGLQPGGN
jgi:hypothetical protein